MKLPPLHAFPGRLREEFGKWKNILRARLRPAIALEDREAVRRPKTVALVGILKEEDEFVDEWIAYHRLLGVEHFYLYDHDPRLPLRRLLKKHAC